MEIRYSYRNAPTIAQFAECDAFIRGLMGPFGSGKSSGCVVELPQRGLAQKPGPDGVRRTRWAVVRNTYRQLEDTTIKTVHQWLPPPLFGDWQPSDHTYTLNAFEGANIELLFRALDRPDHIKNLLSLDLTGAWVNEAREVPWPIIDALQARLGRYPPIREGGPTWHGMILDTNPPDADSKWYRFFEEQAWRSDIGPDGLIAGIQPDSFAAIFKQPSGRSDRAENIPNLPVGYYSKLAIGKTEEWKKVYIDGQYGFVIDGKPVYPEYSDELHCKECAPIPKVPVYRGWDFGLTPACVFAQMLPSGRFIVFDEMVSDNMGVERFSDEVLEHCSQSFASEAEFIDLGDPAGMARSETDEKTCFQILQSKGIDIEPGLQDPTIRQESVRKPLTTIISGRAQFQLHPRCRVLRKGFLGAYQYRRMQTNAERYTDKPDKNEASHPHDALQYVCTRLFASGLILPRAKRNMDEDLVIWSEQGRSGITGY